MPKQTTIAVSGKGGVGKTTVAALLVKMLSDRGDGAVFAVDADPNSCLADYLGLSVEETIGTIREEVIKNISNIPPGMTKERWINLQVQDCIVESKGIDLLELGRPEGPGCYCYINNLLREYESSVHKNYRYIVIDNEAGMEHLSRRSTQKIDYLLIVSNLTKPGLKAAKRIRDLSSELKIVTKNIGLVLNFVEKPLPENSSRFIDETGIEVIGHIPVDPFLVAAGLDNNLLLDIPEDSAALGAVRELSMKLDL